MNAQLFKTYTQQRAAGFNAKYALRNARTLQQWRAGECVHDNCGGTNCYLRLRVVADDDADLSYLDQSEFAGARDAEYERANRDGCTGIVGEYWNGDEWVQVDSCWGFIGDDWRGSGYDTDIMAATIHAHVEWLASQLIQGGV